MGQAFTMNMRWIALAPAHRLDFGYWQSVTKQLELVGLDSTNATDQDVLEAMDRVALRFVTWISEPFSSISRIPSTTSRALQLPFPGTGATHEGRRRAKDPQPG